MAIQIVKGLPPPTEATSAPHNVEREQAKEATTNLSKITQNATAASVNTDAVVSNVRNNRVDKAAAGNGRVREFSEARDLADSVAKRIRTGEGAGAAEVHGGLQAREAASHLA